MNDNEKFMKQAIKEAKKAYEKEEVPVGAVIVKDGKIIARGHNLKESKLNTIKHAEIIAIEKASKKLSSWRLENCDLYVTLEPCMMCTAAIELSRIKKVHYLLKRDKEIIKNKEKYIYEETESSQEVLELLQSFFKSKR